MIDKEKLQQILDHLPPSTLLSASRCLDVLRGLADGAEPCPKPFDVVGRLTDCPNKSLAAAILTAAAELSERRGGEEARKWAATFDWMRHTLADNDIGQLPSMAYAVEDLDGHKWDTAIRHAEDAGGFTPEFMAVVELWEL